MDKDLVELKIKSMFRNTRGQAVLEYLLLTFVVVIILGSIIAGVAHGTQKFAENYFGSYFQCLLETGELPSLGADGVPETECDENYAEFTVREGRPLNMGESAGAGSSGGDGSSSDSAVDANSDSAKGGSSADGGGASPGSSVSAGFGGSGGFEGRSRKVPLSNADKKGKGSGIGQTDGTVAYNNYQDSEEFGENGSGRSSYIPIYGRIDQEGKEENGNGAVRADSYENPEQSLRGKRVPVSISRGEDTKKVIEEDMTFPDFLKIIIIAAIILVIVIFFGGQVMNYNNSKD